MAWAVEPIQQKLQLMTPLDVTARSSRIAIAWAAKRNVCGVVVEMLLCLPSLVIGTHRRMP